MSRTETAPGSSPRVRGTVRVRGGLGQRFRFIPACAGNGPILPWSGRCAPVHPRVCGERPLHIYEVLLRSGSSPRVRGTGQTLLKAKAQARFIPACAGNGASVAAMGALAYGSSPRVRGTVAVPRLPAASTLVHPRVCGERSRSRGCRRPARWFIPACAGNGARAEFLRWRGAVHPRVCGERPVAAEVHHAALGSSPRVRGTERLDLFVDGVERFIPACAGNGRSLLRHPWKRSVHPRVCGERRLHSARRPLNCGSSPRVRGTAETIVGQIVGERFIPACAGNGSVVRHRAPGAGVHPRVCGERMGSHPRGTTTVGSSPRVRGTAVIAAVLDIHARFIPACAGNGPVGGRDRAMRSVHPRVCGERRGMESARLGMRGSSPRVRGTGQQLGQQLIGGRFIPACAGNGPHSRPSLRGRTVHPRVCGERPALRPASATGGGSSPRVRGTARSP